MIYQLPCGCRVYVTGTSSLATWESQCKRHKTSPDESYKQGFYDGVAQEQSEPTSKGGK
jgi:hypothetical protein